MKSLVPKLDAKTTDEISEIMSQTKLTRAVVTGVLGDIARMTVSRESKGQIASRWGVGFGLMNTMKAMGKLTIEDVRCGLVTKNVIIANAASDALMDRMNDPMAVSEMDPKTLMTISKQSTDTALNLENKSAVGVAGTQVNIGEIKMLIQHKESRGEQRSALDILQSAGVKIKDQAELPQEIIAEALETEQE